MKYAISLMTACIVTALPAVANSTPELKTHDTIERVTVLGTHLLNANHSQLAKVVIDEEQIAALAANSVADVLRGLPGVDVFQQGGAGGLTFLSVRGGDPNFVVVLLDGVKVNDPTNSRGGAFDLSTLDPATIEKIELLYGGYSTVYGSDALAGVLSITTKSAKQGDVANASIHLGSAGRYGGAVHLATRVSDLVDLSVTGSLQRDDQSTFGDDFKRQQLALKLNSAHQAPFFWQLNSLYAEGNSKAFPEDSGGERLSVIRLPQATEFQQQNSALTLGYAFTEQLSVELKGTLTDRSEQIDSPAIAPGVIDGVPELQTDSDYQRSDITLLSRYRLSENINFALGVSYADEQGGMQSLINFGVWLPADYRLNRRTKALFAETEMAFEQLTLMAGVRYDDSEALSINTHRVLAQYQLSSDTKLSAHYSEGFKLPSFFALGHPFVGNNALLPERSKNYDLSAERYFPEQRITLTASVFHNRFTDLVDFDPEAFTNINRSQVDAKGIELMGQYQVNSQLFVSGQASYNDTGLKDNEAKLRRRPKLKAGVAIQYQVLAQLSVTARLTANGQYYDSAIPTGMVKMDSHYLLDLSTAWQIQPKLQVRLNIANALDDNTEMAVGFKNYGRNLSLSVSYQL
ncbi:catecholate siderophore receptor CirA [Thalassotalea insulae]|uniref:Catecholate siderophore receptor CirA n=1 Tax=Thalassotalea insulae TaxID=2056778 RepID=A0ABQ6GPB9_9GAMM|nr:TonB-dependent receptor [Thalassotalea insulae]GLX77833.1 catecholate siderophore receptor CirA [Thalassotalea insulae]